MPVYNAGAYLAPAIESVLGQTLRDLELIIVDDVSTDGSLDVARGYAAKDSRVRVMAMENNGGPGIARNRGIDAARGEYLGFMDSDDLMPPDAFQNLYGFAAKENLDIARGATWQTSRIQIRNHGKCLLFQTNGWFSTNLTNCAKWHSALSPIPSGTMTRALNFGGSACSAIFRLSLVNEASIRFEERPHTVSEDYLFCYKCLIHGHSAGVIPEIVYHYRTNPASRSHRLSSRRDRASPQNRRGDGQDDCRGRFQRPRPRICRALCNRHSPRFRQELLPFRRASERTERMVPLPTETSFSASVPQPIPVAYASQDPPHKLRGFL